MPLGTVHVHEPVPVNVFTSYVDPARDTVDVLDVQAAPAGGAAASGMSAMPPIITIAVRGRSSFAARGPRAIFTWRRARKMPAAYFKVWCAGRRKAFVLTLLVTHFLIGSMPYLSLPLFAALD